MVRWSIKQRDRIRGEQLPLYHKRTKARESALPDTNGAHGQIAGGHVIHPGLDGRRLEIADPSQPSAKTAYEQQELLQRPSVGPHASFRFASLLALVDAELVDELDEGLGHGCGPPARATTTFSLRSSIGRDQPAVNRARQPLVLHGPSRVVAVHGHERSARITRSSSRR